MAPWVPFTDSFFAKRYNGFFPTPTHGTSASGSALLLKAVACPPSSHKACAALLLPLEKSSGAVARPNRLKSVAAIGPVFAGPVSGPRVSSPETDA